MKTPLGLPTDWQDWPDALKLKFLDKLKEAKSLESALLHLSQDAMRAERDRCANDVVYFVNTHGRTYDPREKPSDIPFKLFPKQEEFLRWLEARERCREGGLVGKSRDTGVTWLCSGFGLHRWLFQDGCHIGFGSRKLELVDRLGDLDSIFEKIRYLLYHLPVWMLPEGFDRAKHDNYAKLINPANGSSITGEGGDNIGRGGRAQPVDAKVLTPSGWVCMGDIRVGDAVIGKDGKPTRVVRVIPQGVRDVYRVTLSDGSSTECCDEHLWEVTTLSIRKARRRLALKPRRRQRERCLTGRAIYPGWQEQLLTLFAQTGNVSESLEMARIPPQTAYKARQANATFAARWQDALAEGKRQERPSVRPMVLPLAEIRQSLVGERKDQTEHRYQVPMVATVAFASRDVPLDPYLLGVLLGDGSIGFPKTTPSFATADAEMVTLVAARVPEHCHVVPSSNLQYRISDMRGRQGRRGRSPIKQALAELGIAGLTTYNKYVPDLYKYNSPEVRLEVLRGLLDTDGWCSVRGSNGISCAVGFASTSRRLAEDVRFLVQSLGGVAGISKYPEKNRVFPDGKLRHCVSGYSLKITLPHGMCPFRLSRKAANYRERSKYLPRRSIIAVEPIGQKETQCITVAAEDGLYVTDDFIVTHNCSIYVIDEAAHLEKPDAIERSLSATTDVRIDVSTPNGMGNPFARKYHSGTVPVFRLHYSDDPRKTAEWIAKKKASLDPVAWEQEYEINFSATQNGTLIPAAWVRAAVNFPLEPSGACVAGLDVAEDGPNKSVLTARRGPVVQMPIAWGQCNTTETAWKARDHANLLEVTELGFDAIGVGSGVKGTWDTAEEVLGFLPVPVNVGDVPSDDVWPDGKTSKEKFLNLRAELWWKLRQRFERTYEVAQGLASHPPEDLISIPDCQELITQLSLPLYFHTDRGKLKVEAKDTMRRRGIASPDYADSLILSFFHTEEDWYVPGSLTEKLSYRE